ncbi:MAG: hypothetical protein MHM6MM_006176 [Cercozoa sp. M6MM]
MYLLLSCVSLLTSFAAPALADGLVPLSVMKPTCIRFGKCVNSRGQVDPSVCCSGVCDKANGCVSSTEASSILMRMTMAGAPFVCKADSFFGVRCDEPSYFHSGKITSDCSCPEGKPCLIGNGKTPTCSSRFWVGYCDPDTSSCVPQLQLSVDLEKTLFDYPAPTPNNGLGGECTSDDVCDDFDLFCSNVCRVRVGISVATLISPCPKYGFDVGGFVQRDLGDSYVCKSIPGQIALNEPCLCDTDCADPAGGGNAHCVVLLANNLDGLPDAINDKSLLGKCLILEGLAAH